MLIGNAQHLGKLARIVIKKTILPNSVILPKENSTGLSKAHKSFKYREFNVDQESGDDGLIDDITSKVKSMYYHDVHFNSINTRMHINIGMRSCNGNTRNNTISRLTPRQMEICYH